MLGHDSIIGLALMSVSTRHEAGFVNQKVGSAGETGFWRGVVGFEEKIT